MLNKIKSILILVPSIIFIASITGFLLTTVGLVAALIGLTFPNSSIARYALEVWLGFDRMCNAFMNGDSKETVSSRLGKSIYYNHGSVFGCKWADKTVSYLLDCIDPDHCKKSIEFGVGRPIQQSWRYKV